MDSAWLTLDTSLAPEAAALDWLVRQGAVTESDIEQARGLAGSRSALSTLNRMGVLNDDLFAEILSKVTGLPILDLPDTVPASLPAAINPEFLRETRALVLSGAGPVGIVDPLDGRACDGIEYALGFLPDAGILRAGDWSRAFSRYYPGEATVSEFAVEDDAVAIEMAGDDQDAPIVRQVATWLSDAADQGASDVHFDARRSHLEIRYRIDGSLAIVDRQPKGITASVIARIKVIAGLDLGERNRSQDGRATIVVRGRRLDIRVSIIPTIDGEGAVIRLLDRPESLLTLEGLGFSPSVVTALDEVCAKGHGMFIVAGPTGSGKTTTLYSCLERMKGRGLKILSVEDPVEYHFDHVNQVQVSEKAGRTFATALRAFLRHDPDVILVGEIRDQETAQVAVQAALSGHLVLATLHAIDTARVRTRLEDMGVEAFRLDACLLGSLAQRLIRTLCEHCKSPVPVSGLQASAFREHGLDPPTDLFRSEGCSHCRNEGFSGRLALAELARHAGPAVAGQTLATQALRLAASGRTTFAEIAGLL